MNKKERIACLIDAGLCTNESKVLCWFLENKKGVPRKIEQDEGLRQPEISIVVGKFEGKGWITHKDINNGKRGRPQKEYTINEKFMHPFDDIILDLRDKQSKIDGLIKKLQEEW